MLLQPGISDVFQKYSQMNLAMKPESLHQLTRRANETPVDPQQTAPGNLLFCYSLGTAMAEKSRNGFRRARKCFRMGIVYRYCGRVAQLGEHLLCKQGVAGSNPVTSTNSFNDLRVVDIS
jgi:hypothetical protein